MDSKKIKIGDCAKSDNIYICIQPVFETHSGGQSMTVECAKNGEPMAFIPSRFISHQLPTLHLPIKGKWFDMILSGEKTEEYRYWNEFYETRLMFENEDLHMQEFKPLKVLHLTNGYGRHLPQLWAHIESISIGRGNPEWGAPIDRDVFIIRLGDVFHTKNLKQ